MRWVGGSVVWALVACNSLGESSPPGDGSTGATSAGPSSVPPRTCVPTSAPCACTGGLEGHEECDTTDDVVCNCEAPIQIEPLLTCGQPCGGDLTGDWQLVDICTPRWAKGNCEHLIHDATVEFSPSGLTFDAGGKVNGAVRYRSLLQTKLTQVCADRKAGRSSYLDCRGLADSVEQKFEDAFGDSFVGNTCTPAEESCDCETQLNVNGEVNAAFAVDAAINQVSFLDAAFEYCARGDTLSLRGSENEFAFNFRRSTVTLPFMAIALGSVRKAPVPPLPFDLEELDCPSVTTIDTSSGEMSCGGEQVRRASWGGHSNVLFLRSLMVPEGKELRFVGAQPAIIVADTIDVRGKLTFLGTRAGASSGSAGSNQAGGGGGHCTAGGLGGFWTGDSARLGGAPVGSFEGLSFGGPGGSAEYTYTDDVAPGGGGGGAIALLASTSVNVSGLIDVSGASGDATGPTPEFGSGGGAGGMIAIQAPAVTVTATARLRAEGGRGGGGEGGKGSSSASSGANGTTDSASVLGGGGGGAGRIVIGSSDSGANVIAAALIPSVAACTEIGAL